MRIILKKPLRFTVITTMCLALVTLFAVVGCDKSEIPPKTCNIENLYEQPLEVIQKCVQGKWKVLMVSRWGYLGLLHPTNTIVNIDTRNNKVVIEEDEGMSGLIGYLNSTFSYSWEKKEVYSSGVGARPPCYTTHVLQNNDQEIEGWYFDKIINDTLHVVVDYHPDKFDCEAYLFLKIK